MGILNREKEREYRNSTIGSIGETYIEIANSSSLKHSEDYCVLRLKQYWDTRYLSSEGFREKIDIKGSKKELIEFLNTLIDEIKEF